MKSFQAILLFIDDCPYLNNNLACEIYYECDKYSNLTLIFNYREIDELAEISENGYNLFEDTVSQIFNINLFSNQSEKISTLIEKRRKRIYDNSGIIVEVGDLNVINKIINKNLLKLTLLLDKWEKQT